MAKPFSFAHLIGLGKTASEDDEDEKAKKSKAKKAEEEKDDDTDAEEDDEDGDKEKSKKSKAKKADDGDDDDPDAEEDDPDAADDDDDDENKDVKKGRRAERRRCGAIMSSPHAAGRADLAASLAFNTSMSAAAAIKVLAGAAPAVSRRKSLDERMQGNSPRLAPDATNVPDSSTSQGLVSKMTSLYNQAKGIK